MIRTSYKLKPAHTLTVALRNTVGGHVGQVQDPSIGAVITGSHSFGPYLLDRDFIVSGDADVTIAEADFTANVPSTAQAAMLDAIPLEDQEDSATVWSDEGVLKVSGAAA